MNIAGERLTIVQWIEGKTCVVRLEVEAVIPEEDPSEPCFEPEALTLMDEVQELADRDQIDALAKFGQVYIRKPA